LLLGVIVTSYRELSNDECFEMSISHSNEIKPEENQQ